MDEIRFTKPAEIEQESLAIIRRELAGMGISLSPEQEPVILRAIHTTADFDYARNLFFSPDAVSRGVSALAAGTVIVTDTNMARSGISAKALARTGGQALCYMADPAVAEAAKRDGTTRAVASMRMAAKLHPDAVYAIGNAPTALLELDTLLRNGLRPQLIIGVPVGFVNVVESKERLRETCLQLGVPAILAMGRKGGSTVAAAVCNALLYQAGGRDGK